VVHVDDKSRGRYRGRVVRRSGGVRSTEGVWSAGEFESLTAADGGENGHRERSERDERGRDKVAEANGLEKMKGDPF
jgi:hypothetical protein